MSTTYDEAEEDEIAETKIDGNDHYARFYRFLRATLKLTPKEFEKVLKNVDDVFYTNTDIDTFFTVLCKYIELEVSKQIPDESNYMVITFDHHHEISRDDIHPYAHTSVVTYVKWNIGGTERYIMVYDAVIAMSLRIAETRVGFNSLIDEVVKGIASNVSKTVRALQKSGVQ